MHLRNQVREIKLRKKVIFWRPAGDMKTRAEETNQRRERRLGFCWLGWAVVLGRAFSLLFLRPCFHIPPAAGAKECATFFELVDALDFSVHRLEGEGNRCVCESNCGHGVRMMESFLKVSNRKGCLEMIFKNGRSSTIRTSTLPVIDTG